MSRSFGIASSGLLHVCEIGQRPMRSIPAVGPGRYLASRDAPHARIVAWGGRDFRLLWTNRRCAGRALRRSTRVQHMQSRPHSRCRRCTREMHRMATSHRHRLPRPRLSSALCMHWRTRKRHTEERRFRTRGRFPRHCRTSRWRIRRFPRTHLDHRTCRCSSGRRHNFRPVGRSVLLHSNSARHCCCRCSRTPVRHTSLRLCNRFGSKRLPGSIPARRNNLERSCIGAHPCKSQPGRSDMRNPPQCNTVPAGDNQRPGSTSNPQDSIRR